MKKAPAVWSEPLCRTLVAAATVGARPDEGEGVAIFLVEELGVDRSVAARIVQLESPLLMTVSVHMRS